jgi:DNA processing protein
MTGIDRLARAALSRVVGPDDPRVCAQVRRRGAAEVWERLRRNHPDVDPGRDLELVAKVGGRLLCPGDDEWPAELTALDRLAGGSAGEEPGAPLALWVRGTGHLAALLSRAAAVVGSRASTGYGDHLASELGFALAERGWTVVSGAAFGIDAAAHRGALAAGGPTVAVLAGGVDVAYPAAHASLLADIVRHGVVVSEVPPGSPPFRRRFLTRNRLIAAMSRGTVLVEAGYRSGALNTVRHARRLGRTVMAFPGPVTSAMSGGCHRLLRDHREETVLVTGVDDVLEEIGPVGRLAPRDEPGPGRRDGLPQLVRRLLDAMPARSAVGAAVLAQRIGQRPEVVLALLGPLVVEGLVEVRPDGYRLTDLGRAPSNPSTPGPPRPPRPHGTPASGSQPPRTGDLFEEEGTP